MARERYLLHVSEEDLQPTESIGAPTTAKGKWENFWYHYKFPALLLAFVIVAAIVMTVQLLTRETYDYTVTLVTERGLAPNTVELMKAELLPFAQDEDQNGEVSLLVDNIPLTSSGIGDGYEGYQKLMTVIGSGDFMLFAVEKDVYNKHLKETLEADGTFFRPIVTSNGDTVERWEWNAKHALKDAELMQVWYTKDFVWFVRAASGLAAGEKSEAASDAHLRLLETYVAAYEAK